MQWSPVVDYVDLMDQPVNVMAKGQVASVPVLIVRNWNQNMFSSCTDSKKLESKYV